jgi:hypothetical protein
MIVLGQNGQLCSAPEIAAADTLAPGCAYRISGSGTRTVCDGHESFVAEFANQLGPIGDPEAANFLCGFQFASCQ